jgi:hypothetical protein
MANENRLPEMMNPSSPYRYRISSRGASSAKFGPCEVCGRDVSDVHLQVEGEITPASASQHEFTAMTGRDLFGHRECLISQRR